ncbi:hypothetical protein AUEXF2481DRAFT_648898 [Aureobasidium subglaciale EXF-2481]|uniref:Uncharacterized protein n=1 Tax=Aureobasidium subglaciale (strain EXF-2481) TaxID=1043005 RepID=A0A074YKS4_AURSE|nr:uncharacterized protein AUEXF2481DRAFT_648898 [Aureobasidium subglaciale EXF-2481]KEQ96624.1 hypothetical protein AUEXF2481DRAFT_648898 [Aureobasidium subglaciale EXF-2481]
MHKRCDDFSCFFLLCHFSSSFFFEYHLLENPHTCFINRLGRGNHLHGDQGQATIITTERTVADTFCLETTITDVKQMYNHVERSFQRIPSLS